MERKRAVHKINLARRAEIAADKRKKTRSVILVAAFHLIGEERGHFQRIEDFCKASEIARGTFYKYFTGIENLYAVLADELSSDFDAAVHKVMDVKSTSSSRAAAAVRYYLRAAIDNPRWGWAMVHTSMGREVFGSNVSSRAKATIEEGIASGEFQIATAQMGKALLLGACLGGTLEILHGRADGSYPESMARSILLGLGVSRGIVDAVIEEPLPSLQPLDQIESVSPVNFWSEIISLSYDTERANAEAGHP